MSNGQDLVDVDAGTLYRIHEGAHVHVTTYDLLTNNRAVLFGGPAPFSRLDTQQAKEYAELSEQMLNYVNNVYGVYCQDAFVMNQFKMHIETLCTNNKVTFFGDGDANFTKGHDLDIDLRNHGLGIRSCRYAMVVKDRKLEKLFVDHYSTINETSAQKVLEWLKQSK